MAVSRKSPASEIAPTLAMTSASRAAAPPPPPRFRRARVGGTAGGARSSSQTVAHAMFLLPAQSSRAMFPPPQDAPADDRLGRRKPPASRCAVWQVFGKSRVERCVRYVQLERRSARKSQHLASLTPGRRG